jgi:hypothetical protein
MLLTRSPITILYVLFTHIKILLHGEFESPAACGATRLGKNYPAVIKCGSVRYAYRSVRRFSSGAQVVPETCDMQAVQSTESVVLVF